MHFRLFASECQSRETNNAGETELSSLNRMSDDRSDDKLVTH